MNRNALKYYFSGIFFLILLVNNSIAQPRFRAGIVAGLVASQIDGDLSAGYNKLGLQSGIRVTSRLKGKSEASMEFLFSQRGCQNQLIQGDYSAYPFSLRLNYVEVPLQFHYKDWLIEGETEKDNFYRVALNAGFSYARLINTKVDDESSWLSGVAPDYLKKNDFGFCLGFNFFFSKHFGFTFRFYRSLLYMYNPRDWNPAPASRAWNLHCLNFDFAYML